LGPTNQRLGFSGTAPRRIFISNKNFKILSPFSPTILLEIEFVENVVRFKLKNGFVPNKLEKWLSTVLTENKIFLSSSGFNPRGSIFFY